MNLVIILPSGASTRSGGVRIRYLRVAEALEEAGLSVSLVPIDEVDPRHLQCDAVLFSKCYDARALVGAAILARRQIKVGIDLFDDYFSQGSDGRLSRFRSWLRQIVQICDFALCSTAALSTTLRSYRADIPIHVLSDPAPRFEPASLSDSLIRKFDTARSDGVMRTLWFGMGDNPYFPVGLEDLAAFGSSLGEIAAGGIPIELTVLTNARALSAAGLALASQLPVPTRILEWSEVREREILDEACLCFAPVNAQQFSTAKSLNRALTALSAGCQLLTAGYPLYAPLDQFTYGNAGELLDDWRRGRLRFSPSSVAQFQMRISEIGSIEREASSLADFLRHTLETCSVAAVERGPIFLLHGIRTSPSAHDLVKSAGGFSVGTPFCNEALDFDIVVEPTADGQTTLAVSGNALAKVESSLRSTARPAPRRGRRKFWQLGGQPVVWAESGKPLLAWQIAMYAPLMESASATLSTVFGEALHLVSESSSLPVEAGAL